MSGGKDLGATASQSLSEEALRLSEAATPAPWEWWSPGDTDSGVPLKSLGKAGELLNRPVLDCAIYGDPDQADAEFIARARTLLPQLAQQLEQAEQRADNNAVYFNGLYERSTG